LQLRTRAGSLAYWCWGRGYGLEYTGRGERVNAGEVEWDVRRFWRILGGWLGANQAFRRDTQRIRTGKALDSKISDSTIP